jgi:hypothetical protein
LEEDKMVNIENVTSKAKVFIGEKFQYSLSEDKEDTWKKASVKNADKVKAEIMDTVQKSIKRISKVWANGKEYESECKEIAETVIEELGVK